MPGLKEATFCKLLLYLTVFTIFTNLPDETERTEVF